MCHIPCRTDGSKSSSLWEEKDYDVFLHGSISSEIIAGLHLHTSLGSLISQKAPPRFSGDYLTDTRSYVENFR